MWNRCWDTVGLLQSFLFLAVLCWTLDGRVPIGCTWTVLSSSISSPSASAQAFPLHSPSALWDLKTNGCIVNQVLDALFSSALGSEWNFMTRVVTTSDDQEKVVGVFWFWEIHPSSWQTLVDKWYLGRIEIGERLRLKSGQRKSLGMLIQRGKTYGSQVGLKIEGRQCSTGVSNFYVQGNYMNIPIKCRFLFTCLG